MRWLWRMGWRLLTWRMYQRRDLIASTEGLKAANIWFRRELTTRVTP